MLLVRRRSPLCTRGFVSLRHQTVALLSAFAALQVLKLFSICLPHSRNFLPPLLHHPPLVLPLPVIEPTLSLQLNGSKRPGSPLVSWLLLWSSFARMQTRLTFTSLSPSPILSLISAKLGFACNLKRLVLARLNILSSSIGFLRTHSHSF